MLIDLDIPSLNTPGGLHYTLDIQDILVDIPSPILIASLHLQSCLTKYLKDIDGRDVDHILFKISNSNIVDICVKVLGDPEQVARSIIQNLPPERTHIYGAVYDNYYKEVTSFFFRDQLNGYMKSNLYSYITTSDFYKAYVSGTVDSICSENSDLEKETITELVQKAVQDYILKYLDKQEQTVSDNKTILSAISLLVGIDFQGQQDIMTYLEIEDTPFANGFFGSRITQEVRDTVHNKHICIRFKEIGKS